MATGDDRDHVSSRLTAMLHRLDLARREFERLAANGAYWRYAVYVSAIVALAALGGYAASAVLTTASSNYLGAIYTGILTCLSMLFVKPTAERHPFKEIAAAGGAIAIGAGIGGAIGNEPVLSETFMVVAAFAGFYARRWPEPMPMAGLVMMLSFIISQILASVAAPGVIHASMLPLFACVSIGFWFLPRTAFTRAFEKAAGRIRAALAGELADLTESPGAVTASVRRIDDLLYVANAARAQADLYNPAGIDRHMRIIHCAATLARVWENAADSLSAVAATESTARAPAVRACSGAKAAVAAALARPDANNRASARDALARIGDAADCVVRDLDPAEAPDDLSTRLPFQLINAQLALTHLLETAGHLDAALARGEGAGR
ncbi:hypothetical protein [Microbaculum marinum]|uniref:FUSC family protein n=1 Tax=Microbaculum marinum TaxID=1764581 RepID=A0AAW9RTW0_9HYPH